MQAKIREKKFFKSDFASVNGIKMYYEIHGEKGNPLILIHGGGSTIKTSFGNIIQDLSQHFKVIAMELQGHGHTSDRNSPESFEQDAEDIVSLLHHLHVYRATFFGFSNGGNVALQIAFHHAEIVKKLILASTFFKREGLIPGFFEGMKQATIKDMPIPLKDAFLRINPDENKLLTMFNKDREKMLQFKNWRDKDISSINAPTLIINGDQDVVLPSHAVEISTLIKNSRLMILPATHGSYIGVAESVEPNKELIETTIGIIKDFLKAKSPIE